MTGQIPPAASRTGRWDPLSERLHVLRQRAGNPSYADIAKAIFDRRSAEGLDVHAARVPRSTVYDAFRTGRTRPNFDIVREIGAVLGADEAQIAQWIDDCRTPIDADDAGDAPNAPASIKCAVLLMVACIALNMVGRLLVDWLHLPIYLDMVGTAIAAVALGPWRGALVGGATNFVGVFMGGWVSIPFALVNIAGALVWGYGVHRFRMGRTHLRFFSLSIIAAVVCSLVAVPILVFMFGGSVGQGQDTVTQTFLDLGQGLVTAVGFSNLLTSTIDKVISGFVALVVVTALPWHMRRGIPLVTADQRR